MALLAVPHFPTLSPMILKKKKKDSKAYAELLETFKENLKEWIMTDSRNTPLTLNPEDEEIADTPGKNGNASLPEQVKRPNLKMIMMIS